MEAEADHFQKDAAVDGSEIRQTHQLSLVVSPIIYKVLAPSQVGSIAGFLKPSKVSSLSFRVHMQPQGSSTELRTAKRF